MARIRKVEISNFRCIKSLSWTPSPGINCLIGPGDSGKSTIIDAIDLCLGARRAVQFTDADFFNLDVESQITIIITLGELDDHLQNIDYYGLYLRGFNSATGDVEDEPESHLETVLTLCLTIGSDLEPCWALLSDRAKAQDANRNLKWADRVRIAPTRIGALADFNMGWRRGSVLNRLTDEKADASAALAKATRDARAAFGDNADKQLGETLRIVAEAAQELGIDVGAKVRALLDAHSVTFSGGTISLHDADGVPLRGLGIGSSRLLAAGLQRKAAAQSTMLLVDELEYGLEPHRIIRFLGSLGAKDQAPPLQAFVTTHSPVALRELSGSQLFVLRANTVEHNVFSVGTEDDVQSTIRVYPDAFLASSVIICEGASEVGLLRGLDHSRAAAGHVSLSACGVAIIDCGGGEPDKPFKRASAFRQLGYRVAILRDDDQQPSETVEKTFLELGGSVFSWGKGRALEDELFLSMTDETVGKMIDKAVEIHGNSIVNDHIKSASNNETDLNDVTTTILFDNLSDDMRKILGRAAKTKRAGWFKSVSWMEEVAHGIVANDLSNADAGFRENIDMIFKWLNNA